MPKPSADVVVIGGGPAGATVAALTADAGAQVLVLEREAFPRYRIGESLMPATYWTLERLGVLDRMRCSSFPEKHSVQFFPPNGHGSAPFYFSDVDPYESSRTWQVERSEFDRMLLENAANEGADVEHGANVRDVLFDGERAVGVRVERPDGSRHDIGARVVVDASGQRALLGRKLRLRNADPNLLHAAVFTQFEGARRGRGKDAGATLIFHTDEGRSWFWYIPLPGDRTSVGVVGPIDYLIASRVPDPQQVLDEELERCPALRPYLESARQAMPARVVKDFSYACSRIAGDGWVLAGDAFGFLDPIYSSGVFLALKGGEMAADSIIVALENDDVSAARLGRHGPELLAGMEALRKMVYAYYSREFSFSGFLKEHPDCKEQLVNLLIGNVFRQPVDGLLRAMEDYCELPAYEPFRIEEVSRSGADRP